MDERRTRGRRRFFLGRQPLGAGQAASLVFLAAAAGTGRVPRNLGHHGSICNKDQPETASKSGRTPPPCRRGAPEGSPRRSSPLRGRADCGALPRAPHRSTRRPGNQYLLQLPMSEVSGRWFAPSKLTIHRLDRRLSAMMSLKFLMHAMRSPSGDICGSAAVSRSKTSSTRSLDAPAGDAHNGTADRHTIVIAVRSLCMICLQARRCAWRADASSGPGGSRPSISVLAVGRVAVVISALFCGYDRLRRVDLGIRIPIQSAGVAVVVFRRVLVRI